MIQKEDIWEHEIMCSKCKVKTKRTKITKLGFKIRTWECPKCGKQWLHPIDSNKMLKWNKLRNKKFPVKSRLVGNSYVVSIPKEIIEFENIKAGEICEWSLEKPEKLVLKIKED